MLLDSGSESSLIKRSAIKDPGKIQKMATTIKIQGLDGKIFEVNDHILLNIWGKISVEFLIINDLENMREEIILGTNVFEKYKAIINYNNQSISLEDEKNKYIVKFSINDNPSEVKEIKKRIKTGKVKCTSADGKQIKELRRKIRNIKLGSRYSDSIESLDYDSSEMQDCSSDELQDCSSSESPESDWESVHSENDFLQKQEDLMNFNIDENEAFELNNICAQENDELFEKIYEEDELIDELNKSEYFDYNYENRPDLADENYTLRARSLNILRVMTENFCEKGIIMKEKLKEGVIMANSYVDRNFGMPRILILNLNENDIEIKLPKFKIEPYDADSKEKETKILIKRLNKTTNKLDLNRIDKLNEIMPKEHIKSKEQAELFDKIIKQYNRLFFLDNDEFSEIKDFTAEIQLKDEIPINIKQYRTPFGVRDQLKEEIEKMENDGIIEESNTVFNSPVLILKKSPDPITKKPRFRIVVDFRHINKKVIEQSYPLPRMDEIMNELGEAKFYTSADIHNAYHQIKISESSKKYLGFSVNNKKYTYKRLPQGISIAPFIFQSYIMKLMSGINPECINLFLDDILIKGKTLKEIYDNTIRVFDILLRNNIKLNAKKTILFANEILFLGMRISSQGIHPDVERIKKVINWPKPTTVKQVQRFLGFVSYYRKFIPKCYHLADPLYQLLRKENSFEWTQDCENSFEELKSRITSAPILAIPRTDSKFILTTDACSKGFGAVLSQIQDNVERPIAFWSKRIHDKTISKQKASHNFEFEALKAALHEFTPFLKHAGKFLVRTDNIALASILKNTDKNSERKMEWLIQLEGFDFDIQHIKGEKIPHADALSRLYVIRSQNDILNALNEAHDSAVGGHRDFLTTYNRLKDLNIIWPAMTKDIKQYIRTCDLCQKNKVTRYTKQKMKITDTPGEVWEKIILDMVGPVDLSINDNKYILTCRCLFSKYVIALPMKNASAEEVAKTFMKIITTYGSPKIILTDQGTNFMSKMFKNLCKMFKIDKIESTVYRPQTQGSLEVFHRTLKTYIMIFVKNTRAWDEILDLACFSYNTSVNKVTKYTPFEIMFGRKVTIPSTFQSKPLTHFSNYDDYLEKLKQNMRYSFDKIKENIEIEKEQRKKTYDRNANEKSFNIGDEILMLNENYSLRNKQSRWQGPWLVIEKINDHNYKIKCKEGRKWVEKIIHADKLKKYEN
jgi:hypothetical protein